MTALDLVITLLCILSVFRLISYQRGSARFKRHYGILAWLIICIMGSLAIHILGGRICTSDWPILLPLTSIFTLAVYRCRGNVAQLVNVRRFIND